MLNTTAGSGGWYEEGVMTPEQEAEFHRKHNVPGHYQKIRTGGLDRIREPLLGVDVPSQASGQSSCGRNKQ